MARPSLIRRAYDASYGRLFAATYDRMLAGAERGELGARRSEMVGRATGRTLEIGSGTGLNLPHYAAVVSDLVLTEPFAPMAARLRAKLGEHDREAQVVEAAAETLPFDDDSFDTVVATLVLCTVDDPVRAVSEIGRVLRPGGSLILLEHVRAETPGLARAQDLLHGPWLAIGHGCHCNRDTVAVIAGSRLEFETLERTEMSGLAPLVKPVIAGVARLP
jgi:ubiquinone/menaquinone biosynthesis C-methylase UbiE